MGWVSIKRCVTLQSQGLRNCTYVMLSAGFQDTCRLSKKYGDLFTVYEWDQPVIVVCGPKAIKDTLIDNPEEFTGRAYYPTVFDVTKGDDIAFSNGEKWKELRRFGMQTLSNFGFGKSSFEEKIREEGSYLIDVLRKTNGSPIDPNHRIERAVSNVFCILMFGSRFDYNDEQFQKILKCVGENFKLMSSCWGMLYNVCPSVMRHLPGPHRRIKENFGTLAEYLKSRMESKMKTLDSNNPGDFIESFLIKIEKEKKTNAAIFNTNTLVMTSASLFFGGSEAVTQMLRFMLLYLMKYPRVAEKVYKEIDDVLGQRPPTYEDRHNMPYTVAFLNEVQRYADLIPMAIPHKLIMDTQIRGYKIKKGTTFIPLLKSVNSDKTLFDNPENFDLNHFIDENGKLKKTDTWTPFSAGKRMCFGKSLAVVEIFIFTTMMLQSFKIKSPVPPEKISVTPVGVGFGHVPPNFEACFLPRY
ncbi:cytochrome P450 2F2-like isoform X2 [Dendropsophus ebraccatus]|uniref:cytochrome P450 2F2-like isoform X2 n=1 Tax=Dendropsophus ebraccatus TaxID=150705 RepID=UPI0038316D48